MTSRHANPAIAATGASLFARIAAAASPGRPAIVGADGALTWGELLDRARRLGSLLGAGRAPVLVYGHKEPAVVAGILAALRACRPYVPVEPSLPPARIAHMLDATRPADAVLAAEPPPALASELSARGIATVAVDPLAAGVPVAGGARLPDANEPGPPDPEAPAYVLFTSGTTGAPKGVPVSYRALEHFTDWLLATHPFEPDRETFLNQAPFGFDLSVLDLYGALLTGGTSFVLRHDETVDPGRLFRRLDGAPLSVWVSTPSFARLCLAEPGFAQPMLPALRRFLFCGETLPPAVAAELLARFPRAEVWNLYGPTEATVAVTAVRITAALAACGRPLPVGRAAPGTEIWIAHPDDPSRRLPDGVAGEITVAGPQVAAGYLAPAAPGPFFVLPDGRRAYRTGDLGCIDPADGLLYCAGRLDRQIKLRGFRIELEEIETHLRALPGVADASVLVIDRDGRPDYLIAIVVGTTAGATFLPEGGRALTAQVRTALAESLPVYALPRIVRRVPALPLTDHGKLDRHALYRLVT
jgi:D-alanine--poly(phosphoribitol) ligase subunit 1